MKLQEFERGRIRRFLYDYINDICIERKKSNDINDRRCQFYAEDFLI
jgi:hypothetical protein